MTRALRFHAVSRFGPPAQRPQFGVAPAFASGLPHRVLCSGANKFGPILVTRED